jgi:periplasmic protein TonB
MIRVPVSALGGAALALLLFWLLALLVSPPEETFEILDMSLTLSAVEAPEPVPEEAAEPPPEAASEPPEAAPPPPEPPQESPIALPEPELPPEPVEPLELDTELPELTEAVPEPDPVPEPTPEPEPQPVPAPAPQPAPQPAEPAASSPAATSAEPAATSAEPAPREPVDVGAITPTSRVPPDYPTRAQRRGIEGHVELEFVVRADGRVDASTIRVTDARPRNVFEDAARQAVARWRFEPAEGLRRARQRLEFQLR